MITLLTAASKEFWPLFEKTLPNKVEYCLRQGLSISAKRHQNALKGERQLYILDNMKSFNTHWTLFMGADTLIMNMTTDIYTLIDEDYDIIITKDIFGINNDVMLIKNSQNSFIFMKTVYEFRNVFPNDQEAMKEVIKAAPELKVKYLPQRAMNSYKNYLYKRENDITVDFQVGDFVIHFPGLDNYLRLELVDEFLRMVVR